MAAPPGSHRARNRPGLEIVDTLVEHARLAAVPETDADRAGKRRRRTGNRDAGPTRYRPGVPGPQSGTKNGCVADRNRLRRPAKTRRGGGQKPASEPGESGHRKSGRAE